MSDSEDIDWKLYNRIAAEEAAKETGVSEEYAAAVGHNARNDMADDDFLDTDRPVKDYAEYDEDKHGSHDQYEPEQWDEEEEDEEDE